MILMLPNDATPFGESCPGFRSITFSSPPCVELRLTFCQYPLELGNLFFRHADTFGDIRTSHRADSLLAEQDLDQSLVLGRCEQRPDRLVAGLGSLGLKSRHGQLALGLGKPLGVSRCTARWRSNPALRSDVLICPISSKLAARSLASRTT